MTDNTPDYDMGDLIRAMVGNPLDAIAKADTAPDKKDPEPAITEQAQDPSPAEMKELVELATSAAELQDEIKSLLGDRSKRLSAIKKQLKHQMQNFALNEVQIAGRGPIELTSSSSRKGTLKAITLAMQDQHGEVEGKKLAKELWGRIDPTVSWSLSIPDRIPEEPDSPY